MFSETGFSWLDPQNISRAPDRVDQLRLPAFVQFFPEIADIDVDDIRAPLYNHNSRYAAPACP